MTNSKNVKETIRQYAATHRLKYNEAARQLGYRGDQPETVPSIIDLTGYEYLRHVSIMEQNPDTLGGSVALRTDRGTLIANVTVEFDDGLRVPNYGSRFVQHEHLTPMDAGEVDDYLDRISLDVDRALMHVAEREKWGGEPPQHLTVSVPNPNSKRAVPAPVIGKAHYVRFTGPTGAGKSTVVANLTRQLVGEGYQPLIISDDDSVWGDWYITPIERGAMIQMLAQMEKFVAENERAVVVVDAEWFKLSVLNRMNGARDLQSLFEHAVTEAGSLVLLVTEETDTFINTPDYFNAVIPLFGTSKPE